MTADFIFNRTNPINLIKLLNDLNKEDEFNIFEYIDKDKNKIIISNKEFTNSIRLLSEALFDMNLGGSKIGICSTNNINYLIADSAISSSVGISCNINPELELYDLKNILIQIDCEVLFCSSHIYRKLQTIKKKIPVKKYIILDNKIDKALFFDDVVNEGKKNIKLNRFDSNEINYDKPCKVIYEKINEVHILSQRNIVENIMVQNEFGLESIDKQLFIINTPMYDLQTINSVIYHRMFNKMLTKIS